MRWWTTVSGVERGSGLGERANYVEDEDTVFDKMQLKKKKKKESLIALIPFKIL